MDGSRWRALWAMVEKVTGIRAGIYQARFLFAVGRPGFDARIGTGP